MGVLKNIKNFIIKYKWNIASVTVPFILYLYFVLPLSEWLIDDAGISFVYSRNLAAGYGLVTQPGMAPVEGYSNFLWVVVMAFFFLVKLFDPFITSKFVSYLFVLLTFINVNQILSHITKNGNILSILILSFVSLNASFIIWTCSGLENPLYVYLITLLLLYVLKNTYTEFSNKKLLIVSMVAFCIAITRPDGIVYLFLLPFTLIAWKFESKSISLISTLKLIARYLFSYSLFITGFLLFRYLYFNDFYPNTYHVKGGPNIRIVWDILSLQEKYLLKLQDLSAHLLGTNFWLIFPVAIIGTIIFYLIKKENKLDRIIILFVTCISLGVYLLLPIDWMGEYRFATPFHLLSYVVVGLFFYDLFIILKTKLGRISIILLILVVGYSTVQNNYPRLQIWYKTQKVSFSQIARNYGERFNKYAKELELQNASLLVPDIGGTLYYSKLKIYDLGGLCDPVIAKNRGKNQKKFYDYIFDEIKPTFIHTHGYFTVVSKFDEDERFLQDYMPINEYEDKYAERNLHRVVMSGDFIRKDAVVGKEEIVKSLVR